MINATHRKQRQNAKIAPKEQTNFISWRFALLCGCIYWRWFLLWTRRIQIIAPDMLCVRAIRQSVRCVFRKFHLTRYDYRPFRASTGGRCVPVKAICRPKEVHDAVAASASAIAGKRLPRSSFRSISFLRPYQRQPERAFYLFGAPKILTWRTTSKNSNCRAFICVKNPAVTIPVREVTAHPIGLPTSTLPIGIEGEKSF